MKGPRLLSGTALIISALGCTPARTTRLLDGREVVGPRIPEAAYHAYLAGALAEADGRALSAKQHYQQALGWLGSDAPASVEAHTSLGRVLCRLGNISGAESEFESALRLDAGYKEAWLERAKCALNERKTPRLQIALQAAEQAQQVTADSLEPTLLVAETLIKLGREQQAIRQLVAFAVNHPQHRQAWKQLRDTADQVQDPVWRSFAEEHSFGTELVPTPATGLQACVPHASGSQTAPLALLDALRAQNKDLLRRLAANCRVSPVQLAALALDLGRATLALDLAQDALALAPNDGDARALSLLAALRSGQSEALLRGLAAVDDAQPVSKAGLSWLTELNAALAPY